MERVLKVKLKKVGAARFELATSWSQTRRDDRATLRPERCFIAGSKSKLYGPIIMNPGAIFLHIPIHPTIDLEPFESPF